MKIKTTVIWFGYLNLVSNGKDLLILSHLWLAKDF